MFKLSDGKYINLDHVECLWMDNSVIMMRLSSGYVEMISPFDFNEILKIKKYTDAVKTEQAY